MYVNGDQGEAGRLHRASGLALDPSGAVPQQRARTTACRQMEGEGTALSWHWTRRMRRFLKTEIIKAILNHKSAHILDVGISRAVVLFKF